MTYLLDFATQLILSLAVGFSFGAAFVNVLIARLDKKTSNTLKPWKGGSSIMVACLFLSGGSP